MSGRQTIDELMPLRRLLADLQSGETAIVKQGIEVIPTYDSDPEKPPHPRGTIG